MIAERDTDIEPALQDVASEVWQISADNGNTPGDTAEQP
jgi:hypothetical protein